LTLNLLDEFRIEPAQREAIRGLLKTSFPEARFAETRTYLKQAPPRRLLATNASSLVGHLGLEHRVIGTTIGPAPIFGIVDLCVHPLHRGQGIASQMLSCVEALGRRHAIEFLVLFARDARLYERNGFSRARNPLRWVKIHEHQTIGIGEQPLDELMVKPIGQRSWPAGLVDFLGYQF
jgi:GNAT superfamily N-acetyltransferase